MGVSSFAQGLTAQFVNQLQEQINASVLGVANTLEWLLFFGNASDAFQFNGIEAAVNADAKAKLAIGNGGSNLDLGGAALSLTNLDAMIDQTRTYRGSASDKWMFVLSQPMISRVSALQTRVTRLTDRVKMEGGFEM